MTTRTPVLNALILGLLFKALPLAHANATGNEPVVEPAIHAHAIGQRFVESEKSIERIRISPTGEYIAIFTHRDGLEVFERSTGRRTYQERVVGHVESIYGYVETLQWSPSGRFFSLRRSDRIKPQRRGNPPIYRIYSSASGAAVGQLFQGKKDDYSNLVFSPDDRHLLISHLYLKNHYSVSEGYGEIWKISSDGHGLSRTATLYPKDVSREDRKEYFRSEAFTLDGRHVITQTGHGRYAVWTLTGKVVKRFEWSSSDATRLASSDFRSWVPGIYSTDHREGAQVSLERGLDSWNQHFHTQYSPDGRYAVMSDSRWQFGSGTGGLLPFKTKNTHVRRTGDGSLAGSIGGNASFFLPDGKHLLTWVDGDGENRGFALWRLENLELVRTYPCRHDMSHDHAKQINPVVTADGKRIISRAGCMIRGSDADIEEIEIDTLTDFSLGNIDHALRDTGKWLYPYRRDFVNQIAEALSKYPRPENVSDSKNAYPWLLAMKLIQIYFEDVDSKVMKEQILPSLERRMREYDQATGMRRLGDIPLNPEVRQLTLQMISLSLISLQNFATQAEDSAQISKLKSLSALAQAAPRDRIAIENLIRGLEEAQGWSDRITSNSRTRGNGMILQALQEYLTRGN